jgi:hexosaminidase
LPYDVGVYVEPADEEMMAIGEYLAGKLRAATGFDIPVRALEGAAPARSITLTTTGGDLTLGDEGYELNVTEIGVRLAAPRPAGLFRGVQTIRQLLPPAIESSSFQQGPGTMATGIIRDYPRFKWRGVMLDVARHFFTVEDVKRYIDLAATYKLNRFHLHLTDDQGWRIEIRAWPNLATYGGSTEVGGGEGGYYTQEQYADIAAYAQSRHMILVREIDMPGIPCGAGSPRAELLRRSARLYTEIGSDLARCVLSADRAFCGRRGAGSGGDHPWAVHPYRRG